MYAVKKIKKKKSIALRRAADYDLKKSKEVVGPLLPVLRDKNGRLIDGLHRLHADKDWPTLTLPIRGVDGDIARIVVNVQRRQASPKEKTEMLEDLAEKTRWSPEEIAEKTGMSISWVRKYLPSQYKDKAMADLANKKHEKARKIVSVEKASNCPNCKSNLVLVYVCPECGGMTEKVSE